MRNPQLVDYIREQIAVGHTESSIRQHLLAHGWQANKVDAAFARSSQSEVRTRLSKRGSKLTERRDHPGPRRGGRENVPRRKPRSGWRTGLALMVLVLASIGWFWWHRSQAPALPPVRTPTYQQKQSLDVITVGGAVGQYVATNNRTLPSRLIPAPDGSNSVVLCGDACNPTSWQVSNLSAYTPSGVHMLTYRPDLTVPDADTMYVVTGASCTPNRTAPPVQGKTSLSAVILYADKSGAALQQHCVIL